MNNEYEKRIIVKKIDQATDEISSTWDNLNIHNIKRLDEIWNDTITQEYIDKYEKVNTIIKSILSNLNNLKKDWEDYLQEQDTNIQ